MAETPPIVLPTHSTTRFMRSTLALGDGAVRWTVPRTLLGVIPLGHRTIEIPFEDVIDVGVHRFSIRFFNAVAGILLMVLPATNGLGWWAVPLFVLGFWVTAASLVSYAWIRRTGGHTDRAYVCFGHLIDAELHTDLIRASLPERGVPEPG